MTKTCTDCHRELPIEEFSRSGRYRRSYCKPCSNERSRHYGAANRERRNARLRAWRRANPEAARQKDRRARLRRKYDLTEEDAAALVATFGGQCWLCRQRPATAVDHDHSTGRVRGALCAGCNSVVLARADADSDYLARVAAYQLAGDHRAFLDQPCHADVLLELANTKDNA